MDCRTFRENHAAFLDGEVGDEQFVVMQRHVADCTACAAHDTAIRRALLIVRNLPPIELSADFGPRLRQRLQGIEVHRSSRGVRVGIGHMRSPASAFAALAAGLMIAGFVGVSSLHRTSVAVRPLALAPVVAMAPAMAVVDGRALSNIRRRFIPLNPADDTGDPEWAPFGGPAVAASLAGGMPVWPAAVLAARPPRGWGAPEMKLTNLQR
jgi:anti-sigma factor RsiW